MFEKCGWPHEKSGTERGLNVGRLVSVILGIGLLLAQTVSAGAKVSTVEHWHHGWAGDLVLNYLVEMKGEYERANPNSRVALLTVPGGDYANKLVTATAAGVGPDLVEWWLGPTTAGVVSGMFEDLFPYVKRDGIKLNEFIPSAIDSYMWEDTLWGLPNSGYPFLTLYSQAVWDEAGLVDPYEQGDAWTWDSVISSGQKLVRKAAAQDAPDRYAVQVKFDCVHRTEVWAYQAGGAFFDRPINPTKSLFSSGPALSALTWLSELVERGLVSPDYPQGTELVTGEVATLLWNGPQQVMSAAYQPEPGRLNTTIGVAPLPRGPVHNGTFFITDGWMISSSSKSKEAAWQWLKYIATDVNRSARFAQHTGRIPGMIRAIRAYLETLPEGLLHGHVIMDQTVASTTRVGLTQHINMDQIQAVLVEQFGAVRDREQAPRIALELVHDRVSQLLN